MAAKALVLHRVYAPCALALTSAARVPGTWANLAVAIAKYVEAELASAVGRKTGLANTVSSLFRKCIRKAEESGRVAGALRDETWHRSCVGPEQLSHQPLRVPKWRLEP
jgi:hypothetical protein